MQLKDLAQIIPDKSNNCFLWQAKGVSDGSVSFAGQVQWVNNWYVSNAASTWKGTDELGFTDE